MMQRFSLFQRTFSPIGKPQPFNWISSRFQSSVPARRTPRAKPRTSALALPAEEHIRWSELTKAQKVVYATRQTSYFAWIVVGLGVTGTVVGAIVSELWGRDRVTKVYSKSLEMIQSNEQAQSLLGSPIKGFREHSRGHWKLLQTYEDPNTGKVTGKMRYGISGPISEGTVSVWVEKNTSSGQWDYQYVLLESPGRGLPSRQVVILDQRRRNEEIPATQETSFSELAYSQS